MRALICAFYFPPAGGGGVQRPLKMAAQLPSHGIDVHVLTPRDTRWLHRDEGLAEPPNARVHRTAYCGPGGRRPA